MDCIFCKIIKGDIPSFKIYEDDTVMAFLDINPDTNGHTLIIPKKHYKDLMDIDNDTLMHIMDVARTLSDRIIDILKANGITLIQNNGDIQEVKHFHLHLKPYYTETTKKLEVEEIYNMLKK